LLYGCALTAVTTSKSGPTSAVPASQGRIAAYRIGGSEVKCKLVRAALERLEGERDVFSPPDVERGDFEAERAGRRVSDRTRR
jgi:hypothetical protein